MGGEQNWVGIAVYFAAFIALFYVLIIMPRKKQEKKQKELVESLAKGDKVVTIGGIKGEISKLKEDSVFLKINKEIEIEILRKAIAFRSEE